MTGLSSSQSYTFSNKPVFVVLLIVLLRETQLERVRRVKMDGCQPHIYQSTTRELQQKDRVSERRLPRLRAERHLQYLIYPSPAERRLTTVHPPASNIPDSNVAIPKNDMKPAMSVTVVNMIEEDKAGS